jgi:CRISPR system Cascade subunit CasC
VKLIELHILQSFPVSCLNRDDVGAPKTATFGGVSRARISSQCLKRAIRELARELSPELFAGLRSRLIITPLADALAKYGVAEEKSVEVAKQIGDYLAMLDPAAAKKGDLKVKTLMFLSPAELDSVAKELAEVLNKKPTEKELQKAAAKACKAAALKDAADIAIFGRMVASDHSLTVEGAGLFSHALSTHRADNDIDFFSAVDDRQSEDEAGAGMTGTLEFTSATYYRYIALNLGMLSDDAHLSALEPKERKKVVEAFLRAALFAVPNARKNSMNAHTLPGYVLGIVKEGQPLQLVNAFESPVRSNKGIMDASIAALKEHHKQVKETWSIKPALEIAIPDKPMDEFCTEILAHV